eukprot:8139769-Heterocapsa_arctica.AAC.1
MNDTGDDVAMRATQQGIAAAAAAIPQLIGDHGNGIDGMINEAGGNLIGNAPDPEYLTLGSAPTRQEV